MNLVAEFSQPITCMFKVPDTRLSASNSAVLASESFLVPVTLRSEAKGSEAALDALCRAFEEVKGFAPALGGTAPGVVLVSFNEAVSPRLSRVDIVVRGKEHQIDLIFAFRCPLPKDRDFWGRLRFISAVYDRLSQLAGVFEDRKGIELFFEEARLDQQKEDPERLRMFRK
jgi:hypothetical protein